MATFFDQRGQRAPAPLQLPSKGELEAPYLQHDAAIRRIKADQAMAALAEQQASQRQQASLGSALQIAQMQQATAERGQDMDMQQANMQIRQQQIMALENAKHQAVVEQQEQQKFNLNLIKFQQETKEKIKQQELSDKVQAAYDSGDAHLLNKALLAKDPANAIKLMTAQQKMAGEENKDLANTSKVGLIKLSKAKTPEEAESIKRQYRDIFDSMGFSEDELNDPNKVKLLSVTNNDPKALLSQSNAAFQNVKDNRTKIEATVRRVNNLQQLRTITDQLNTKGLQKGGYAGLAEQELKVQIQNGKLSQEDAALIIQGRQLTSQLAVDLLQVAFTGPTTDHELNIVMKAQPSINMPIEASEAIIKYQLQAAQLATEESKLYEEYVTKARTDEGYSEWLKTTPFWEKLQQVKQASEADMKALDEKYKNLNISSSKKTSDISKIKPSDLKNMSVEELNALRSQLNK